LKGETTVYIKHPFHYSVLEENVNTKSAWQNNDIAQSEVTPVAKMDFLSMTYYQRINC
jgi:hypothetical protein